MIRFRPSLLALGLLMAAGASVLAMDPPHQISVANKYGSLNYCSACHKFHGATGGTLTTVQGNANVCLSCHVSGGSAQAKAFVASDQAIPAGLVGATAGGTSHRWDSGPQGRLTKGTPNTSTGTIKPSGAYTGAYASTVEIKISTAGAAGVAKYDWRMTTAGSTTVWTASTLAVATSTTATALGTTGVSLAFSGTGTFNLNDIFYLYVRADLRAPVAAAMLGRTENGTMMCSSCHDQHVQAQAPFDPLASATYTAGVTNNRHFQRVANNTGGMCGDCHAKRDVGKGGTSHPVHVNRAAAPNTKAPSASLILNAAGNVECLTCHDIHQAPATSPSGMLLRVSNSTALCTDCHTLADTTTANAHTNPTTGILWLGDQYGGSTYPAYTLAADRGACKNCHTPHGWPDAGNPTQSYGGGFGARQDNLCMTCHDGAPAKDTRTQIVKTVRHPVARTSGRIVGCGDCHNPHMAAPGIHAYATTATLDRNRIRSTDGLTRYSNALRGANGVRFNYTGMANWAVPAVAAYTKIASGSPTVPASGAEFEYQICFKCHTSYDPAASTLTNTVLRTVAWGGITNEYSTGTAKFTNASTAVVGTGTIWVTTMVGMYIQKDVASPAYRITAASALSITITPAYVGANDAGGLPYTITKQQTDLAQEFNPANASFHPVAAGLAPAGGGSSSALTAAQMKAPWNTPGNSITKVGLGYQTMMCSDCHNTDAASPAAQGPHGSAAKFMLRGPNTIWPLTTAGSFSVATYNTTFCANCHTYTSGTHKPHDSHTGRATCYNCHILVPHGGKLARLIGDGDSPNFPARYAYQNNKANMFMTSFTKAASPSAYSSSNCSTNGCQHSNTGLSDW